MKRMWMLSILAAAVALPAAVEAQMVIVVRHAERADGGAGTGTAMTANPDPELSEAGKSRALRMAAMLGDAGVVAIYTTEYRRTKDTAGPLAARAGVAAEVIPAREAAALMGKIKAHKSGTVVVVGHSNTVPAIIKALGGSEVKVADDEYDSMYVVAADGTTTRIRFQP